MGDRNAGDLKALEGREWDVCIDNPTTLPFWVRDAGRVLHGKVKHYIFISTISVYANDDAPPMNPHRSLRMMAKMRWRRHGFFMPTWNSMDPSKQSANRRPRGSFRI